MLLEEITQVMQNYTIDSNNTEGAFYFIVQFFNILDSNKELCLALLRPAWRYGIRRTD